MRSCCESAIYGGEEAHIFADNSANHFAHIGNLIYLRNGNDMICIFSRFSPIPPLFQLRNANKITESIWENVHLTVLCNFALPILMC
jgi:hypothetical protein